MTDELKTERIQVLLSPSVLKEIDDWSFEHRIRSRGEAIRRLIRSGIVADAAQDAASKAFRLVRVYREGGDGAEVYDDFTKSLERYVSELQIDSALSAEAGRIVKDAFSKLSDEQKQRIIPTSFDKETEERLEQMDAELFERAALALITKINK